ncbi:hypothetical protein OG196_42955 (plasmid) [Kitasatospora purpeofusca]|uniref:hypothetical protein n=1 Tax=Kitasatospora purpeofusca TaxID=67352 RepID=UPI002E14A4DD|nr:hypothetical protein OG196_42955 [Kitasatospora purpeofusca]
MDSAPPTAATDQPTTTGEEQTRHCARPGCSHPVPTPHTGRPRIYCSRSCRSKVDRAKAKAREAAVAAGSAAAPDPTAASSGAAADPAAVSPSAVHAAPAAPAADVGADDVLGRWGEDGRHLLGTAEALHRRLTRFLEETANGDPVTAFADLAKVLPVYGTRAYMAAQEIRDKARWPDLDEHERLVARSRERIDHWDNDDGPDNDDGVAPEGTTASRGETPAAPAPTEQPSPPAPEDEPVPETGPVPAWRSVAEAAEQARRAACTDPEIRFDFPDLLDDLAPTFGPGWELGSWLTPAAQGVLQLRHDSTPVGWAAPLPDGPWGQAGWIALLHQPDGARLLVDTLSRPETHPTADLALDAVLRAHRTRPPLVMGREAGSS